MKIQKTVTIKEVAKVRERLIKLFEKQKKHEYSDEELKYTENLAEDVLEWVIEEVQEALWFDGEEEASS